VPNPIFNLLPSATVDEGNNWVNITWGPLSLSNPVTGARLGNYTLAAQSPAIDYIPHCTNGTDNPNCTGFGNAVNPAYTSAPTTDFFGNPRPDVRNSSIDIGAVEYQAPANPAIVAVTPTSLSFGNVTDGTTSAAKTLTVANTGGSAFTFTSIVVTAPFSQAGGTCGATLAANASCTILVTFSPTAPPGLAKGTVTITGSVPVTGSPVALSGTGVAAVVSATLTPTSWTVRQTRNCPGTGFGVIACGLDPTQAFTLTNTGNVTLTGIAQGALGGTAANVANYTVIRLLSTCGPAGNGQLTGNTTLAPGASCAVTVQFKPLTSQAAGAKPATISVTDAAGTQSSALNGTAQ
jgi:hypothetical protein